MMESELRSLLSLRDPDVLQAPGSPGREGAVCRPVKSDLGLMMARSNQTEPPGGQSALTQIPAIGMIRSRK